MEQTELINSVIEELQKHDRVHDDEIAKLLLANAQMVNDVAMRLSDIERRLAKLEGQNTKFLAFAGLVGTGVGYILANMNYFKAYIRSLLS